MLGRPATYAAALLMLAASAVLMVRLPGFFAWHGGQSYAFTLWSTLTACCCSAAVIGSGLRLPAGPLWRWLSNAS